MKKSTIVFLVIMAAFVAIVVFLLRGIFFGEPKPQTKPDVAPGPSNIFDPASPISTTTGATPTAEPKTLKDYTGSAVIADLDGIKVYYNNPLSTAKIYKKGQYIGHLGSEETDNYICPNRVGWYRIHDTNILQHNQFLGTYITPPCDVIMDGSALKRIFKIS